MCIIDTQQKPIFTVYMHMLHNKNTIPHSLLFQLNKNVVLLLFLQNGAAFPLVQKQWNKYREECITWNKRDKCYSLKMQQEAKKYNKEA